jgi:peptidoglycan/LPS O-acetylase OafA/YrhL
LSYEFWYYIFFPLIVTICIASSSLTARVISVLVLFLTMHFCGLGICAEFSLWLFGAGTALLPLALPSARRRSVTAIAGLLVLVTVFFELKYSINIYVSDLSLGLVFTFFLWTILHARQSTVGPHYRTTAQFLSNMSYTLYLVHMPCFVLISALLMPVWHTWPLSLKSILSVLAIYIVVFFVCWLMYFCFERNTDRLRNWMSSLVSRRTSYAPQG